MGSSPIGRATDFQELTSTFHKIWPCEPKMGPISYASSLEFLLWHFQTRRGLYILRAGGSAPQFHAFGTARYQSFLVLDAVRPTRSGGSGPNPDVQRQRTKAARRLRKAIRKREDARGAPRRPQPVTMRLAAQLHKRTSASLGSPSS
jgi:hypothetical protein